MRRVLITGVQSCLGRQVVAQLQAANACSEFENLILIGTGRQLQPADEIASQLDCYVPCDLLDPEMVSQLAAIAQPDWIFHLARVAASDETHADVHCEQRAIELLSNAVLQHQQQRPVRGIVAGSSAEYGPLSASALPVNEAAQCAPGTSYGRQKWQQSSWAMRQTGSQLQWMVARLFNLIGPHLSAALAPGRFARELVAAQPLGSCEIFCGSLSARRDFVDVRDAAAAMLLLAQRGVPGEIYNICSGTSHRLQYIAERLAAVAGVDARWKTDSVNSVNDLPEMRGCFQKLEQQTGWRPQIELETSLADLLTSVGAQRIVSNSAATLSAV